MKDHKPNPNEVPTGGDSVTAFFCFQVSTTCQLVGHLIAMPQGQVEHRCFLCDITEVDALNQSDLWENRIGSILSRMDQGNTTFLHAPKFALIRPQKVFFLFGTTEQIHQLWLTMTNSCVVSDRLQKEWLVDSWTESFAQIHSADLCGKIDTSLINLARG